MGIAFLAGLAAPAAAPAENLGAPIFASSFESGTICAWSSAVGWSGAPCVALQITITEGGSPLADGALFNRDVVPVVGTTGGTAPITLEATLNGAPFTSGSTVTGDGEFLLEVSAEDADGWIAQRTVSFTIDTLAPVFVSVAPPEGFVTSSPAVVLSGEVSGATTLTVNGVSLVLADDHFTSDPLPLSEGAQSFFLVATDLAGNPTPLARTIVRDSLSPGVTISQPAPGVVGSSPITVAGTATDPHLGQVLVNGQTAAVAGASFVREGLTLVEGANEIVVEAFDAVGNPPGSASVIVSLDTQAPVLAFLEGGLPLADGALFNRTVSPVVAATDATQVNLSVTINGAPFASGTLVADEGSYTLQATAVDEGGNSANLAASFVIDMTAPAFVTVLPPDNTLVAAPEIALSGEVADAQSVTVDGLACTLAVEAFACPSFPLADGERLFTLLARDPAGNEAPRQHRIRRDGTGPEVVLSTPAEGAYLSSADVTATGTVVDAHLAEVRVNGVQANLVGDAWSAGPIAFGEGAATIQVIARDTVDNATVVSREVTIDTIVPAVELLESGVPLEADALFTRAVTPVIVVTDASPWTLVATLDGTAFVSGTPVVSEGLHVLQATATDSAGNPATRQVSFRVDGSPPALVTISPADGFVTAESEVHLQGQILGADTLTIDGAPVTLLGDQFIAGPYPLTEGERTFALVARDAAGNELSRAHHVVRDVTAPTVSIQQPAAGMLVGTNAVQVTGQAADPHLASVAVNGVAASLSGSTWVAPQVPLAEGASTLVATAVDRAGNSATASRVVVRDSQAPTLTITDPAAGSVVPEAAVEVSGSVDEPNLDRVTVQGVAAPVQGGSFSASVALVEGDNTLVVRATDRLGHTAEATRLVRRDSTAPGLEIAAPQEGSRIAALSVAVSGTIEEENGVTLSVNGVPAAIVGNGFSVAAVPLIEGENRLIARARDANGNEGVRTRTVARDTVAPTLLGTEPPAGALAIALTTVFTAELSEEPGPGSVAGMRLETGAGAALASTVEIVGAELRLIPVAPLPSSGFVRLILGPGIADLAGNPLAAGSTLEFSTADASAPAAPTVLNPPPRFLCADELILAGFAEPDRWVEVAGGAGAARVRASSDGAFSVAVSLIPGAIHRLAVTSVDDAGNRSPATEIEVVHDCAAPIVETVDASASGFAIQFSEEIDPASFAGSILVSNAAGAIDGIVALDVDLATFTAAAALPEGVLRVEVLRQPRDLAGNLLAYPWVSVFGGDAAESFFVGTVIDDAVGRPLAGARSRVLSTNGAPATGQALEATSAGDGAVSIPVPVGTHLVVFEHPDSTPVFRFVTTEAQQGADVVDPRLTPLSTAVAVGSAGGTVEAGTALAGPAAELLIPAGALADSIAISLTGLSEQGLPRLLPFGWSPRAAVWIGPEETELLLPATLSLPLDAIPGSTVAWVHLDPATRVWRVEGVTTLGIPELELPVVAAGAWAVVEADPPPFAVPAAVVGEPLGSLPAPPVETILGATLAFDPETVLPGQRSLATVAYSASEAAASGSTVTLSIAEDLQLLDGSTRTEPAYRADLVVYRTEEGARSRFALASSEAAHRLPIELGEENVAVFPYGGEVVRGNVLGPQGGSVLDPSGDRIDIPGGALVRPTPVQLEPAAEGTLPLQVPQGFAFVGALRLDLSGESLLGPATLFLALGEPPAAGETGILFGVESLIGGDSTWRPLATITPSGSGWQSDPLVPADLPWPGVARGGLFLFARSLAPLGFVRGTVFDVGGAALASGVVASDAVEWIQLSGSDGRYAFPAWVGPVALTATKPSTGDRGSGSALLAAAGERVDLDLLLAIVPPSVLSTTPASGATGVPIGIEPAIQFSEPVERTSLAAAITLRPVGGASLDFDLHHHGAQVTLEPAVSLEPETTYEWVIGEGVRDLQGHGMSASVTVLFTTQSLTLPSTVDLSRVLLYAPGTNGESRIQGLPGAAPAGTLVFAENLTRLAATVSVAADQDGSFELSIVAQVTDRLLLHVLIPGANEVVAILGPFRTADGRGAYVGAEGSTFTTIDGWAFTVPAGAFDATSVVHVVPRVTGQLPVPLSASFVEGVSFTLDFGGTSPAKAIELALRLLDPNLRQLMDDVGRPAVDVVLLHHAPHTPHAPPLLFERHVDG
ncbi:MAG: Ig-like domain-containing protein, partial [Thermoanaerobaculia bacterium]